MAFSHEFPPKLNHSLYLAAEQRLFTSRLVLKPILPAHAELLFEELQADELYKFIPQDAPTSLELLKARFEKLALRRSPDGKEVWLNYAIRLRDNNPYVGMLQATYLGETSFLAYSVFPQFWRQGFAAESCKALITHLFTVYHVSKVVALVDTRNEASWRLLETLSFGRTQTLMKAAFFKKSWSDEYQYELNNTDILQKPCAWYRGRCHDYSRIAAITKTKTGSCCSS